MLTEGIKWTIRPGSGDLPVGQFDAQKRLPKGSGMPSLANSKRSIISNVSLRMQK